jgi:hypothetical protein
MDQRSIEKHLRRWNRSGIPCAAAACQRFSGSPTTTDPYERYFCVPQTFAGCGTILMQWLSPNGAALGEAWSP